MKGAFTPEMLQGHGGTAHRIRHGEPRPGDQLRRGQEARADIIVATGRSDYPNQVNNVLGFPFIFRGALDVRAQRHQ